MKQERLAAKPNADSIARSKKIWEKLRTKSKVSKEDRLNLVQELFEIITGRVKEFVFKHDAVRIIQCALKYASPEQKKQIVDELKGSYRELAESKYAKFLVAKLIVLDASVRHVVVPEFYGHVKRMIRHPEASWIMDDIYRTMASKEQKARLLREWYGGEFAVPEMQAKDEDVTADLDLILEEAPGKRGPIMQHLKEMTNQLVQKKTTGFTMLHDALLQYLLNCPPGSSEHTEFMEMLRDDEEGDLFKNMAFTKSGSRVVCLALAYGTSKDRRTILKHYKSHIRTMVSDPCAHTVILAAYEVIDDTVTTSKAIFPELTMSTLDSRARHQEIVSMASQINARIPLLYLMAEEPPKWLLDARHHELIAEIREIRKETSKKDSTTRRNELNKALSPPLIEAIGTQVETLLQTSFGCQFVSEVMLGALSDKDNTANRLAGLATDHGFTELVSSTHAGRLYKTLVQGGRFDSETKSIKPAEYSINLNNKLFEAMKLKEDEGFLLSWATGPNSWSLVAMLESDGFDHTDDLLAFLLKNRSHLEVPKDDPASDSGSKMLLRKIGVSPSKASGSAKSLKKKQVLEVEPGKTKDNDGSKPARQLKKPKLIEVKDEQSEQKPKRKSRKTA